MNATVASTVSMAGVTNLFENGSYFFCTN